MKFDFIIALIIALVLLLMVMIFFRGQLEKMIEPMKYDVQKSTFCAEWVKNNCSIIDPAYNSDLAGLGICEACTPWELPVGEYPMNMSLDEVEKEMQRVCGGEEGEWLKCKKACGCPGYYQYEESGEDEE